MGNMADPKKTIRLAAIMVFLFLFPHLARADAGTPLMWLSMLHLVIGNLFVGLFEAALILILFKPRIGMLTVGIMIFANYFSAWCGYFLLRHCQDAFSNSVTINHALAFLIGAMIVLMLATYVIEWPFCFMIFLKEPRRWRKSILATLSSQTASYAVLLFFYLSASPITVVTKTKIEPNYNFAEVPMARVYYIGLNDGAIWCKRLDGTAPVKIADTREMGNQSMLTGKLGDNGKDVDLWLVRSNHIPYQRPVVSEERILKNFARHAVQGMSGDLRPLNQRHWQIEIGHWSAEGIYAHKDETGEKFWLAMETPLISWFPHPGTLLPGEQMIYQLGNMILMVDFNTRQLALVAMGRGPMVGFD